MDFESFEDLLSRQRAVRAFDTTRPVDDALIERMLRLATYAPNGGNRQPWRFIVVRDRSTRAKLAAIYEELVASYLGGRAQGQTSWREVPVLIAVSSEPLGMAGVAGTSLAAASIFPAVQNLLLAAHALGLGSVLTTLWKAREADVRSILGLPDDFEVHAILPVGWPDRRYGRSRRRPFSEVTFRDRFGQAW